MSREADVRSWRRGVDVWRRREAGDPAPPCRSRCAPRARPGASGDERLGCRVVGRRVGRRCRFPLSRGWPAPSLGVAAKWEPGPADGACRPVRLDRQTRLPYLRRPPHGAIAQLGERLHGMQEVGGSIPPGSTIFLHKDLARVRGEFLAGYPWGYRQHLSRLLSARPSSDSQAELVHDCARSERRVCGDERSRKPYTAAAAWLQRESAYLRKVARLLDTAGGRLTSVLGRCRESEAAP